MAFYDTPALTIHNTSGGTFEERVNILARLPSRNSELPRHSAINLGNLAAGDTTEIWGFLPGHGNYPSSGPGGNLASYDYDDEWGNTPSGYTNGNCVVGGSLCSLVGNFSVTFNATVVGGTFNGDAVTSVFSPTTNYTGGFVGWEGLDPTGLSESILRPAPRFDHRHAGGDHARLDGHPRTLDLGHDACRLRRVGLHRLPTKKSVPPLRRF